MYELLRKQIMKRTIIRVIIALVMIAVYFVMFQLTIIELIKGPAQITYDMDFAAYEGKQVTYDARCVLSEYVRIEESNTRTSATKVTDIGYLVFDEESGWLFGIQLKNKNEAGMDKLMEESIDYFLMYTDEQPEGIKVTGTLIKLEDDDLRYYNETIDYLFEEVPEWKDYAAPYAIVDGTIGGVTSVAFYIFTAAAVLILIYLIYIIACFFTGKYKKKINKFLEENPSVSFNHIESDFAAASLFGKGVWIGTRWTFYIDGIYASLIPNKDIVWAYYFRRTGKRSESHIKIYTKEKKYYQINGSEKLSMEILQHYARQFPHIVTGYDKELEKLYSKDFEKFLEIKYRTEAAASEFEF